MFRLDLKNFLILLLFGPLSLGVFNLVYGFYYNKLYIRDLVDQGFMALLPQDEAMSLSKQVGITIPILSQPDDGSGYRYSGSEPQYKSKVGLGFVCLGKV